MMHASNSASCIQQIRIEAALRQAERFAESNLSEVFEKLVDVKETIAELTSDGGYVPRNRIEEECGHNAGLALQLLKQHDFVENRGKGGNWRYVGQ